MPCREGARDPGIEALERPPRRCRKHEAQRPTPLTPARAAGALAPRSDRIAAPQRGLATRMTAELVTSGNAVDATFTCTRMRSVVTSCAWMEA